MTSHGGKTIGFIGLGTMGLPMVTNLARAGVRLAVHDVNPDALDRAAALDGVAGAASARAVAERSEVL
ncbi:MAG TPA: NAD(P)-binding domain-containing protein, partial [Methylomirabilota bacterium]|nr:NAD(P)-binding domain-containing protein [Methylomirabilota bacterium]